MKIKKLTLTTFTLLLGFSSYAKTKGVEVYFSEKRENSFACTVARSMKRSYSGKSLHDLRRGIKTILRDQIRPYVDADPIPAGIRFPKIVDRIIGVPGLPMERSEYWLQNAFILYANPTLKLDHPTKNYFASFLHLGRTRHMAYLNGEAPKFKLRNEGDLRQQIEEHLPVVANYKFPYRDAQGKVIKQKVKAGQKIKEKDRYTIAIGDPSNKMFERFVYESARFNKFASPLFMWLLDQDKYSVTPEELFNKALEIYGDPLVALGVIPWIMSGDALTLNRGTSSVVSFKLEQLVEGHDAPGFAYHFWGYLTQAINGNRIRVGSLAYLYEVAYQHDMPDWAIDKLSLTVGKKIRYFFKHPKKCLE